MNTKTIANSVIISILVIISNIATAEQPAISMPPVFSIDEQAEDLLSEYPLGTVTMQAAFSHHGAPVRKLTLPNGNTGWLYSIGEKAGVPNIYILQFSNEGVVIDVLHKSLHFKNGHSALQYQFLNKITPKLIYTGPGPG